MGVGAFPETHPLSMQWFGMHGAAYGNWAVDQSDLLLCFGARFDDRITGDTFQIRRPSQDRPHRHRRFRAQQKQARPVSDLLSDIKYALQRLNELGATFTPPDTAAWHAQIAQWKKDHPFGYEPSKHIQPAGGRCRALRAHQR
jgi:acetolactate synthase-1/2/3 large subunit